MACLLRLLEKARAVLVGVAYCKGFRFHVVAVAAAAITFSSCFSTPPASVTLVWFLVVEQTQKPITV